MILSPRSPSIPLQLRGFCANQKCVKITKEGERRSYGINEQRTRDIIQSPSLSLSHLSLCTHTPPLLLSAFVSSSSQFPSKLCFPFFHPLLSFSPCLSLPSFSSHKFLDYLVFYLQFPPLLSFPPPPPSPSFSSASAPLGSCVLVGVVGGLALCHARSVSAALAHPSAHPAPWSLINESSIVFVYQPVIC